MSVFFARLRNNAVKLSKAGTSVILETRPGPCAGPLLPSARGPPILPTWNRSPTGQSRMMSPIHCWQPYDLRARAFDLGEETPIAGSGAQYRTGIDHAVLRSDSR
jgi:hypothetical protein